MSAPLRGDRVTVDVRRGATYDRAGCLVDVITATPGYVLHVDEANGRAWVVLDGDIHPRSVPWDELRHVAHDLPGAR